MIRLASPDISERDIERCAEVLRSGMLVQGPNVAALEDAIAGFAGFGACAAVSSGTAALHTALMALGIGPGDAVLVPAFTFPATANVVEALGARTVLCDVDPASYVLTAEGMEAALDDHGGDAVRAVIAVDEFGFPAPMAEIAALARARGMAVIEDACCALGSTLGGAHVGAHADAACFSFHPRKAVTTGEGGCVLAREPGLIERVRRLRNHGIEAKDGVADFTAAGLNYRLTDFQAALALGQVERFGAAVARRRDLAARYAYLLAGIPGLALPEPDDGHSWQSYMVVLDDGLDRLAVIGELHAAGIEANLGAQALHELGYFAEKYGHGADAFPNASRLYRSGLALPLHPGLLDDEVLHVAATLRSVIGNG